MNSHVLCNRLLILRRPQNSQREIRSNPDARLRHPKSKSEAQPFAKRAIHARKAPKARYFTRKTQVGTLRGMGTSTRTGSRGLFDMQKVLVVDDEDAVRSVIVKTLTHFGFATSEARDGMAATRMAQADPPNLIICDVRMPGMDGYQTLAAIRDMPAIANTPFIFLTAAMDKREIRRGMVSGADDYLTKPFTMEELLEAVTTRLARQVELKCEIYKQAEKLRADVVHLFSKELTAPLEGILGLTSSMMQEYSVIPPERVFVTARQIKESILRLNQLTQSLT
ncbi:MAG: hybrid sensor histidine kinase/response regulator [Pedosphaera sp.]|nr:hybrid sensor histidine kinase/response regulator [Pedosphaera sp.]